MSIRNLEIAKEMKAAGSILGREGLSKRVIALVEEFDGSYIGAMRLAGRMKAIAQSAQFDGYWSEKVGLGYDSEQRQIIRISVGLEAEKETKC